MTTRITATGFGKRLRRIRKYQDITLEALAKQVAYSKGYLCDLENKPDITPSVVLAYALADALNTTVDVLMGIAKWVPPDD